MFEIVGNQPLLCNHKSTNESVRQIQLESSYITKTDVSFRKTFLQKLENQISSCKFHEEDNWNRTMFIWLNKKKNSVAEVLCNSHDIFITRTHMEPHYQLTIPVRFALNQEPGSCLNIVRQIWELIGTGVRLIH